MYSCGFVGGCFGGVMSILVGYPFDTLKVYQQTNANLTMLSCSQDIVKSQGIRGLFRGISMPMASSGIVNSMFFGTFEVTAHFIERRVYQNKNLELKWGRDRDDSIAHLGYADTSVLIGGSIAGATQVIFGCPSELLKIKKQCWTYLPPATSNTSAPTTSSKPHIRSFSLARLIYQKHGWRGLYQGSAFYLLREVPSSAFYMVTYHKFTGLLNHIHAHFFPRVEISRNKYTIPFLAGGVSGVVSSVISLPFDVLKSREQSVSFSLTRHVSMADQMTLFYREQGLKGFSRGIVPLTIRSFPVNGAAFAAYEWFVSLCNSPFKFSVKWPPAK